MDYKTQVEEINKTLRVRAEGLKGIDIALKSGVKQPTISNWLRGMDCAPEALFKISKSLGQKLVIKLEQDWTSGEEDNND